MEGCLKIMKICVHIIYWLQCYSNLGFQILKLFLYTNNSSQIGICIYNLLFISLTSIDRLYGNQLVHGGKKGSIFFLIQETKPWLYNESSLYIRNIFCFMF